jgi:hypothetical protein
MAGLSCLRPNVAIKTIARPPSAPTSTKGIIKPVFCETKKYEMTPTTVTTASVMPVLVTTSSMVSGRATPACCWSGYCVTYGSACTACAP